MTFNEHNLHSLHLSDTWNQAWSPQILQPFHNEREYRAIKIEITTKNIHANIIKDPE